MGLRTAALGCNRFVVAYFLYVQPCAHISWVHPAQAFEKALLQRDARAMSRWLAKVSACLEIHSNAFFFRSPPAPLSPLQTLFFPPLSPQMFRCILSGTLSSCHRTPPDMSPRPRVQVDVSRGPLILASSPSCSSSVHGICLPSHAGKPSAPLHRKTYP